MDNTKMPAGFKLVIVWSFLTLVVSLNALSQVVSVGISAGVIVGVVIGISSSLFVIVAIYLKRWRKPLLVILIAQILLRLVSPIQALLLPASYYVSLNPKFQNLSPEQLDQAMKVAKFAVAGAGGAGLLVGLLVLLYVYKHRDYFRS